MRKEVRRFTLLPNSVTIPTRPKPATPTMRAARAPCTMLNPVLSVLALSR